MAMVAGVEVDWTCTRELFSLDPKVAHLNHGATGAVPVPVRRVHQRLLRELDANPSAFFGRGLRDRIAHTRRHLAAFLGADPAGTALVTNATTAVNVVLNSIRAGPGDEILITDHSFGPVTLAVRRLADRTGASVRVIGLPLDATDDEVVAAIGDGARRGRTRLAIVDQVTSATAKLLPVARIVAELRGLDVPVLVDAAHAPGMLPVDVASVGADYWLGNLHKWAFGVLPTAVLVVAEPHRAAIEPLVVSWALPEGFPTSVESGGAYDYTAWLAAPAGLQLLRALGADEVRRHNAELAALGQRMLGAALGLAEAELPQPTAGPDPVSMRVVPLPSGTVDGVAATDELRDLIATTLNTEVALNWWQDRALLRISAQIYNRPEEYHRFALALPDLLTAWRRR